jgi:hypothetical protein
MPEDECVFESALTETVRDQIVSDLMAILSRLDALELWQSAAHLSSAIDSIQNEAVLEQTSTEA